AECSSCFLDEHLNSTEALGESLVCVRDMNQLSSKKDKVACTYDFRGKPLFTFNEESDEYVLIGMLNNFHKCASQNKVYTSVQPMLSWIRKESLQRDFATTRGK